MGTPIVAFSGNIGGGGIQGIGAADANGGLLVIEKNLLGCAPGESAIRDFDGQTGGLLWNTAIDYDCAHPSIAVGPEGHAYFADVTHSSLITLDGTTGAQIGRYDMPLTTVPDDPNIYSGQMSNPAVGPGGTVFALALKFFDRNPADNQLWLLTMTPAGSVSVSQLPVPGGFADVLFAKVIPDGNGSAFAAWQDGSGAIHLSHGTSDAIVPLSSPPSEMVLDENGVVYASSVNSNNQGTITALAGGTTPLWSYSTAAGDAIRLIGAVTGAGGVVALDQQQGLIPLDPNGNPGSPSATPFHNTNCFRSTSIVSPFASGNWGGANERRRFDV